MTEEVIKVEKLSKQYRLGEITTGSIAHDLNRWLYRVRGKTDPYLKVGEENDRSHKGSSEYVWALKDIDFKVKRGDVLGIIGRNGAGKSTLLKILSRTTSPTFGQIKLKGRVASLLEVGTGFHPDLSGRDNVFLNGAILGMTKSEISRKFDEIVDFSGVERYIDTPVKRYSSGMYVRLAFAVAAHLEPEILIVDEVLAVGDAEFQKKALGKMKDVSIGGGRTVLFVSHNMSAIENLCNRCILLKNGNLIKDSSTEEVIQYYIESGRKADLVSGIPENREGTGDARIVSIEVMNSNNDRVKEFRFGEDIHINIHYELKTTDIYPNIILSVYNDRDVLISNMSNAYSGDINNSTSVSCIIKGNLFNKGTYYLNVALFYGTVGMGANVVDKVNQFEAFSIVGGDPFNTGALPITGSLILVPSWVNL